MTESYKEIGEILGICLVITILVCIFVVQTIIKNAKK